MAAIVKANTTLSTGGLVVLRRSFQTSSRGQVSYNADYVCLAQFANTHAPKFRSKTEPPSSLPPALLLLNLTRTPTLEALETTTEHGLTYYKATYTAGVETDLIFTTTSEQRNVTWRGVDRGTGETAIYSFDYISVSETVTGTNTAIPVVKGSTGRVFNIRGTTASLILSGKLSNLVQKTVESQRSTRGRGGEYENSATSTGVYEADDVVVGRVRRQNTAETIIKNTGKRLFTFPDKNKYDPTSLTGRTGGRAFSGLDLSRSFFY